MAAVAIVAATVPYLFSRPTPIVPVRRKLWEESFDFIHAHPLFGLGPNQFQSRLNEKYFGNVFLERYFLPFAPNSHNLFLVLWVDWGITGLVGFLGLVGWVIRRLIKHWDRAAVVPAAMLTATLVHGVVDTPVLKNDLAILFMVMLVLAGRLGTASKPRRRA
jgi:O-antigen ligase